MILALGLVSFSFLTRSTSSIPAAIATLLILLAHPGHAHHSHPACHHQMSTAGGHQKLKEMATLPKGTEFSNKDDMPEDLDGQWMRLSSFRRKAGSMPHFRMGDGVIPRKKHCSCQESGVTQGQ